MSLAGGSIRARPRDPAQLSSLREPGAQDPKGPQAPQATQTVGEGQVLQTTCCAGCGGRGGGEGRCHLKAWARPVGVLDEGSGILQDTARDLSPGPPSSPSGTGHWLSGSTNGSSLTVGHLGRGPLKH